MANTIGTYGLIICLIVIGWGFAMIAIGYVFQKCRSLVSFVGRLLERQHSS